MTRAILILCATPLLIGCPGGDDGGDGALTDTRLVYCVQESLVYDDGQSTNPFLEAGGHQRQPRCWDLAIDVDAETETLAITLARTDDDSDPSPGCLFTGGGTTTSAQLTAGFCAMPTPTGHYYLELASPAPLDPATLLDDATFEIPLRWHEARGDDLVSGTGKLVLVRYGHAGIEPDHAAYDPRVPVDPRAGCAPLPSCTRVDFAGRGLVVAGNPAVCDDWLRSFAEPFDVFLDDQQRMSFGDVPERDRFVPVYDAAGCGLTAWGGTRPYPFSTYHLEPTAMQMNHTVIWTVDTLTDVCTTRWTTTALGPCL